MDAKVGGTFKMSFTNFTSGKSHSFGGQYLELNIEEGILGTEVNILQEGVPEVIPAEACYLGWQESLILLGKLVEAEIPD